MVDVFCTIYAEAVPPDGLEEVYRLHERARGGLPHLDVPHTHPHAVAAADVVGRARQRRGQAREAPG